MPKQDTYLDRIGRLPGHICLGLVGGWRWLIRVLSRSQAAHPVANRPVVAPTALHLGFAGSRSLWPADWSAQQREQGHARLVELLAEEISGLKARLGLEGPGHGTSENGHFWVGISQVAIGADSVFADVCTRLNMPHRVFLPQPRGSYLTASGSAGPDFDETRGEQTAAIARLQRDNVIQERVVGRDDDRHTRFTETNAEIQRIANVVMTLQVAEAGSGKAGGTNELAEMAKRHAKPVHALRLHIDHDELRLESDLSLPKNFKPPSLPQGLADPTLKRDGFIEQAKKITAEQAANLQARFERRTKVVIWTHVGATLLATAALAFSYARPDGLSGPMFYGIVSLILLAELVLLGRGLYTHQRLHHDHDTQTWAESRLMSELLRSAITFEPKLPSKQDPIGFGGQHSDLRHLFVLPLPSTFLPLADTVNVLHLWTTRTQRNADWKTLRDRYLATRFDDPKSSQIDYYRRNAKQAERESETAHACFSVAAAIAILATFLKLLLPLAKATPTLAALLPAVVTHMTPTAAVLSGLAIVMPVLAVAVLSQAASLDKQARASHFKEVLGFLTEQRERLQRAEVRPEFLRLQAETELHLLGETVNWYYRRRYINPA